MSARHWSELSAEPSDPRCIAHRAETLRAAWRDPVGDRIEYLRDRCRNRTVLDIGCVAHDAERSGSATWLHAQISAVAQSCVGVDVLPEAVGALVAQGFDVICHDFTEGLGPFHSKSFDVIVAGELIEHLGSLDMLFRTAAELLADDGVLIITTPNPYAPARIRAGLRGIVYENCDHVAYAFPSGVAELADRSALRLVEARTTTPASSQSSRVRRLKQWIRSSGWRNAGVSTLGKARVRAVRDWGPLTRLLSDHRFVGETFIYVVARPNGPCR